MFQQALTLGEQDMYVLRLRDTGTGFQWVSDEWHARACANANRHTAFNWRRSSARGCFIKWRRMQKVVVFVQEED